MSEVIMLLKNVILSIAKNLRQKFAFGHSGVDSSLPDQNDNPLACRSRIKKKAAGKFPAAFFTF